MFPFEAPPETPLGLLMACHERIDRYLGGLDQLARAEPGDALAPPTARAVARYLREGLPLHGQDEDRSLAPRLRALGPSSRLEAALDRLQREHEEMEAGLPALLALLDEISAGGRADPGALRPRQAWLDGLLRAHVAFEEAEVFPEISRLDAAEQAAIVREIRSRRG